MYFYKLIVVVYFIAIIADSLVKDVIINIFNVVPVYEVISKVQ